MQLYFSLGTKRTFELLIILTLNYFISFDNMIDFRK